MHQSIVDMCNQKNIFSFIFAFKLSCKMQSIKMANQTRRENPLLSSIQFKKFHPLTQTHDGLWFPEQVVLLHSYVLLGIQVRDVCDA